MLAVYIIVSILIFVSAVLAGVRVRNFKDLRLKEHPLKFLYPLSALICGALGKGRGEAKTEGLMKGLKVKENVKEDVLMYRIRRCAAAVCVIFAASLAGIALCIAGNVRKNVDTLERKDYPSYYELEVDYGGKTEQIGIDVEGRKLTDEEILEMFSDAYEPVIAMMLKDNESLDAVSGPLDFVSSYGPINVTWDTEDMDLIDYGGNVRYEAEEGEAVLVNLRMKFTLQELSEEYTVPVVIRCRQKSEEELLLESILKNIEENNDVHEGEVSLPDEIGGEKITFRKNLPGKEWTFLALGLIGALAVLIVFDRRMEEKDRKRKEEMAADFTEIVTKLSLLHDAGLSIFKSWERIVSDYEARGEERYAYREMKLALEKINSGMSEAECYREFGRRCGLHQYIKLGNLLEQNLTKGTKGLKVLLRQEVDEAFEERTRHARKKGEEASTKMLVPMMIMLVVVIAIVMVPALISINI